jgi:hypothetical protein
VPLRDVRLRVAAVTAEGRSVRYGPVIERLAAGEQRLILLPEGETTVIDADAAVLSASIAE